MDECVHALPSVKYQVIDSKFDYLPIKNRKKSLFIYDNDKYSI